MDGPQKSCMKCYMLRWLASAWYRRYIPTYIDLFIRYF